MSAVMDDEPAQDEQGIIRECVKRFNLASDAEQTNRAEALTDLKFGNGDQWPADVTRDRESDGRPCLTINITDAMVRRVSNACRENRPRIKFHPVGDGADIKTAKVRNGMMRHIEATSNADYAYDTAVESAIRGGWGYMRASSKYVDEKSFDQDLIIERIRNPFTVYADPGSTAPDGSDMGWCIVTDMMRRDEFNEQYGDAAPYSRVRAATAAAWNFLGNGDGIADWSGKEHIRVAEYWRIVSEEDTLCLLSTGKNVLKSVLRSKEAKGLMGENGVTIVRERPTIIRKVKWYLLTSDRILDQRDWPGKFIPIVPVYGRELDVNGKVSRKGMIRDMRDPARMFNYAETSKTELYALQPKAPWLMAEGSMEGHEAAWRDANRKPIVAIEYKPTLDAAGNPNPPPQRQNPPPVAAGFSEWSQSSQSNFMIVAGMPNEPGQDASGEVVSGIAIQRRQGLSDVSHYDFYDNLVRSLRHLGTIVNDLIPYFYDTERMQRIIGDDSTPDMVKINEKQMDPMTGAILAVKNDMTGGRYDVVVDTGPGYQTKRQESAEAMLQLLSTPLGQMTAQVAGDVVVRSLDFPEADTIADRMAAMIPGAQIDKSSDIPPKAQMMIAGLQAQLKQANQRTLGLQLELESKHGLEQMRQQGETQRVQMKEQAENARTRMKIGAQVHDTHVKSVTAHDVAEIHGATQLLNTHAEAEHAAKAADRLIAEGTERSVE